MNARIYGCYPEGAKYKAAVKRFRDHFWVSCNIGGELIKVRRGLQKNKSMATNQVYFSRALYGYGRMPSGEHGWIRAVILENGRLEYCRHYRNKPDAFEIH